MITMRTEKGKRVKLNYRRPKMTQLEYGVAFAVHQFALNN